MDITDKVTEMGPTDTHKKDADGNPIRRTKTTGEWLFDRVVYTGIGFGVNEAMSLWITDQFVHGKNLLEKTPGFLKTMGSWFSKTGFDKLSQKIADTFKLKEIMAEGQKLSPKARGGNTLLMATLLIGGTLLVLPMKLIEDNKAYWVKKANHLMDRFRSQKLTSEEMVKRDDEVEQAIACSPKQSWPTLLIGRAIAMLASWSTGTWMGKKRNDRVEDFSHNMLTGAIKETNTLFGGTEKSPLARFADWNVTKRYARLVGLETYSCTISSVTLELVSKLLSCVWPRVHNPELCRETKEEQASVPAAPPSESAPVDTAERSCGRCLVPKPAASHAEQVRLQKQAENQLSQTI